MRSKVIEESRTAHRGLLWNGEFQTGLQGVGGMDQKIPKRQKSQPTPKNLGQGELHTCRNIKFSNFSIILALSITSFDNDGLFCTTLAGVKYWWFSPVV